MLPPPPISHSNTSQVETIAIKLSKNCGHQNALLAGLEYARDKCDCVISIDGDLQQDCEKFDEFVAKFVAGADIVLGVREDRQSDSVFKKYSALGFYAFMQALGVNLVTNHADYRLLSKRALEALKSYDERNLFLRALVLDLGFRLDFVKFSVKEREAGESKYSLAKMLSFAWNGITSFSIKPLRLVSMLGMTFFVLFAGFGLYALFMRLFTTQTISGWASIVIVLCFFSAVQLLSLGIIGEYIGKMYQEIKHRPRFIIEEVV
ncbi:glycosyltransferase [Helicobacter sp. CLO-3]|uniref:glycosyltransferase n=1 Tax=Helicobacter sp. CLO-3 TaxID=211 RepID=UPI0009F4D3A9|nr:glycosyltransferase [Helicobacter sp. CLO-3]